MTRPFSGSRCWGLRGWLEEKGCVDCQAALASSHIVEAAAAIDWSLVKKGERPSNVVCLISTCVNCPFTIWYLGMASALWV